MLRCGMKYDYSTFHICILKFWICGCLWWFMLSNQINERQIAVRYSYMTVHYMLQNRLVTVLMNVWQLTSRTHLKTNLEHNIIMSLCIGYKLCHASTLLTFVVVKMRFNVIQVWIMGESTNPPIFCNQSNCSQFSVSV